MVNILGWITSLVGLLILIFTNVVLTPMVYFLSDFVLLNGASSAVQGKLMWEMQAGFYIMGFILMVAPFIIDNFKREETGMEY